MNQKSSTRQHKKAETGPAPKAGGESFYLQDHRPKTTAQLKPGANTAGGTTGGESQSNLPAQLKNGIEKLSGISMDDVKVHYNSGKPAQLQAHAYAQGTDIHMAPGQEKHLPHEAWHVVQQKQGRVKPTMQMKGNVPVNDNKGLEAEADAMGAKANQYTGEIVQSKSISKMAASIIQRKQIEAQINGVTHLVLAKGGSIFEGAEYRQVTHGTTLIIDNGQKLRSRRGPNQETHTEEDRQGEQNNRWIKVISVNGAEVPDDVYVRADTVVVNDVRDVAPSGPVGPTRARPIGRDSHLAGPTRALSPQDQARWNKLGKYTSLTVAAPEKQPISKVPGFDHSEYPQAAQQYIDQFEIISKRTFDNKINEIAYGIMRLGQYSCIVSEVGKSNFWLTGKVLDQVRRLGGAPPTMVISLPVKEKGALDQRIAGQYAARLENAGHIVFIDDGSYSGNQLVKFINNVIGEANIPHSVGLVASTDEATGKIANREGSPTTWLANPHRIGTFGGGMDTAYRSLKLAVHHDNPDKRKEPADGDALAALHYKVPDYASVRHKLLVGTSGKPGPVTGYVQGSGMPIRVHGKDHIIGYNNGVEPYKNLDFLRAIDKEGSLANMGIEDFAPAPAKKGFGNLNSKFI